MHYELILLKKHLIKEFQLTRSAFYELLIRRFVSN